MVQYVLAATIIAFLTAWAWYRYLFPTADADFAGGNPSEQPRIKSAVLTIIGLILLAAATGTFIQNRGIVDTVDVIKLAIKIWFGFFFPIALVAWAHTRASMTTLVATVGYWLLVALEYAVLAQWLLL